MHVKGQKTLIGTEQHPDWMVGTTNCITTLTELLLLQPQSKVEKPVQKSGVETHHPHPDLHVTLNCVVACQMATLWQDQKWIWASLFLFLPPNRSKSKHISHAYTYMNKPACTHLHIHTAMYTPVYTPAYTHLNIHTLIYTPVYTPIYTELHPDTFIIKPCTSCLQNLKTEPAKSGPPEPNPAPPPAKKNSSRCKQRRSNDVKAQKTIANSTFGFSIVSAALWYRNLTI